MIGQSLAAGIAGIRRRPGLVFLFYGIDLALALVLSVPVLIALGEVVGPTGFGDDLAAGFDAVLWADILHWAGPLLGGVQMQLLWLVPLLLLWKVAAGVGLVHALRGDAVRSFWQGVGRYTGKGVLVALCYLVPLGVLAVAIVVGALILNALWSGEVGVFWINFVLVPVLAIGGLAVLDLMHDYARIALVVDEKPALKAALTGLAWPFKHGQASWLYLIWFVLAMLLLVVPTALDANIVGATGVAIWGLFLLQQVPLVLRAAVTVGWIGSETALYETVRLREMPLIAEAEAESEAVLAEEEIPDVAYDDPAMT